VSRRRVLFERYVSLLSSVRTLFKYNSNVYLGRKSNIYSRILSASRLFYRQRLFTYAITKLVAIAKTADEEVRIQCAVSAVYLLEELPQSVVAGHFKEVSEK
jgi:hypothetical protein